MIVRDQSHKRLPLSAPDISLHKAEGGLSQTVDDRGAIDGIVDRLEAEFGSMLGVRCAAVVSGTAAMHLAVKLLEIREGDEVVCPTLTFVATCNPVLYERAVPVFLDSEARTWNL